MRKRGLLLLRLACLSEGLRTQTLTEQLQQDQLAERQVVARAMGTTSRPLSSADMSQSSRKPDPLKTLATLFLAAKPSSAFSAVGVPFPVGNPTFAAGSETRHRAAHPVLVVSTTEDLKSLTIKVLKDKLRARKLKVSGNKQELVERLAAAGREEVEDNNQMKPGPILQAAGREEVEDNNQMKPGPLLQAADREEVEDNTQMKPGPILQAPQVAGENHEDAIPNTIIYEDLNNNPSMQVLQGSSPAEMKSQAEKMLRALAPKVGPKAASVGPKARVTTEPAWAPGMWGKCQVGTTVAQTLEYLELLSPVPIQEAAFDPIRDGGNVVIASETGSGKTLAYLLPLIPKIGFRKPCSVMIVVPKIVLGEQVKRVVDSVWPTMTTRTGRTRGAAKIIGDDGDVALEVDWMHHDKITDIRMELMNLDEHPVLIGTPHSVQQLIAEALTVLAGDGGSRGRSEAQMLVSNLKTLVLDEADLLLNSAGFEVAKKQEQEFHEKSKKPAFLAEKKRWAKLLKKAQFKPTKTQRMLEKLPKSLKQLQIVCASATAGPTLCRQLQGILETPRVEDTAWLVSGREQKSEDEREIFATVLPSTLRHKYFIVERDETVQRWEHVADALFKAMNQVTPAPAMIFVPSDAEKVAGALLARGLKDVRRLKLLYEAEDPEPETSPYAEEVSAPDDAAEAAETSDSPAVELGPWADVPVYIGAESYGRGIDLEVDYVFLASPPSSSATYTHLAGRTARLGKEGTAITVLEPYQAPRVVAFAEHLSVPFTSLG